MTTDHTGDGALPPELEAIAAAAHDRLHAQAGAGSIRSEEAARRVAEAAERRDRRRRGARARSPTPSATASSAPARRLSADVLRQVARAAKRKQDADTEYEQAITPRQPARTLPPRDRRRRAGLARNRPRDPHPRHPEREREPATSRCDRRAGGERPSSAQ